MGLAHEAWGLPLFSVLGGGWLLADGGTVLEGMPGPLTERDIGSSGIIGFGGDAEKLRAPSNVSLLLSHSSCSTRVCCLFLPGSPAYGTTKRQQRRLAPEDAPHSPPERTILDPVGCSTTSPPPPRHPVPSTSESPTCSPCFSPMPQLPPQALHFTSEQPLLRNLRWVGVGRQTQGLSREGQERFLLVAFKVSVCIAL